LTKPPWNLLPQVSAYIQRGFSPDSTFPSVDSSGRVVEARRREEHQPEVLQVSANQ
jgi:hypothetical protein